MTNRATILNELENLGSSLKDHNHQNMYTVPAGYFDGLADQILNRIKALNANSAKDELKYLSALLSEVSKQTPYSVPAGFFQSLSEDVLKRIGEHENHQTSEEEIEDLSPFLSSLKNKNPYSVPAGYFDSIGTEVVRKDSFGENKKAKVISITRRKWYSIVAAAVVISIVAVSGLFIFKNRQTDIAKNSEKIIKDVVKKVDAEKIDEFVLLTNDDSTERSDSESEAAKKAEIKELMKDVPEKEIEEFLIDALALESTNDTDGSMNE